MATKKALMVLVGVGMLIVGMGGTTLTGQMSDADGNNLTLKIYKDGNLWTTSDGTLSYILYDYPDSVVVSTRGNDATVYFNVPSGWYVVSIYVGGVLVHNQQMVAFSGRNAEYVVDYGPSMWHGRNRVVGILTDAITSEPVAGAYIMATPPGMGGYSNESGSYSLDMPYMGPGDPVITVTVSVVAAGYSGQNIIFEYGGQYETIDLELGGGDAGGGDAGGGDAGGGDAGGGDAGGGDAGGGDAGGGDAGGGITPTQFPVNMLIVIVGALLVLVGLRGAVFGGA
jgi:hypothetical protein